MPQRKTQLAEESDLRQTSKDSNGGGGRFTVMSSMARARKTMNVVADKVSQGRRGSLDDWAKMGGRTGKSVRAIQVNVHQEQPKTCSGRMRARIKRMISSPFFDIAIGFVIIANSLSIGLELSYELRGKDTGHFDRLENFFLFVYTVELALRFYVYGLECLTNTWVLFDLILVSIGLMVSLVIVPFLKTMPPGFAPLMILRTLRLFRLARLVRLLVAFKTLWVLVRGLASSAGTICWTFVLVNLILYVWACLGVELITNHKSARGPEADPAFKACVDEYFNSVPQIMLTMLRFVLLDSPSGIYDPIVKGPGGDAKLLAYFLVFMFVVGIALMNLVTAVIVENAMENAKNDREVERAYREEEKKNVLEKVKDTFEILDEDQSGCLTRWEIETAPDEVKENLCELLEESNYNDVIQLLDSIIDIDQEDGVSIDEFIDGIHKLTLGTQSRELLQINKLVDSMVASADPEGHGKTPKQDSSPAQCDAEPQQTDLSGASPEQLVKLKQTVEDLISMMQIDQQVQIDNSIHTPEEGSDPPSDQEFWHPRANNASTRRPRPGNGLTGDSDAIPNERAQKNQNELVLAKDTTEKLELENEELRGQLLERGMQLEEVEDELQEKDAMVQNFTATLIEHIEAVEKQISDKEQAEAEAAMRDQNAATAAAAIVKQAKEKNAAGRPENPHGADPPAGMVGSETSRWAHAPNIVQLAQAGKRLKGAIPTAKIPKPDKRTQGKSDLPATSLTHAQLADRVGVAKRTNPTARLHWQLCSQQAGSEDLDPRQQTQRFLIEFLQEVNPALLRAGPFTSASAR